MSEHCIKLFGYLKATANLVHLNSWKKTFNTQKIQQFLIINYFNQISFEEKS